jgi:hypothetical protein
VAARESAEFMYLLNPATRGLEDRDPQLAADLRNSIGEALADHLGPDRVQTPSATWVVSAVAP